eukprot:14597204-Ditylum_brightwellii.AAC.1
MALDGMEYAVSFMGISDAAEAEADNKMVLDGTELGPVLRSVILNYGELLYDYGTLPRNMHYGP